MRSIESPPLPITRNPIPKSSCIAPGVDDITRVRRKDRLQADPEAIRDVIRRSTVCRLAMCDGDQPYVIPICFGYEDGVLYLHCAPEGRKIEILKRNPKVCVEFDIDSVVAPAAEAHKFTMRYRSVIAFGIASFVTDTVAKRHALDILMAQYAEGKFAYRASQVTKTCIIRVDITEITGKESGWGENKVQGRNRPEASGESYVDD